MKATFFYFFIMVLAVLFLSCSNAKKKDPIQEAKDETERQLAEKNARVKWPYVKAREFPVDSLDLRIEDLSTPELEQSFDIVEDSVFILSDEEFNIARELVKKHFAGIDTSIDKDEREKPYPYNYYFKQYIGYKDHKRKKKLVYVNMFTGEQTPHGWAKELKDMWLKYYDAGKWYGHMLVDVENKEVINFAITII